MVSSGTALLQMQQVPFANCWLSAGSFVSCCDKSEGRPFITNPKQGVSGIHQDILVHQIALLPRPVDPTLSCCPSTLPGGIGLKRRLQTLRHFIQKEARAQHHRSHFETFLEYSAL